AEDDIRRRETLVDVRAAAHHGDPGAAEAPDDERARMTERGRDGPARDLAVRDLDCFLDRVGEAAEPRAEDDADARLDSGTSGDRFGRTVERRDHACSSAG